MLGAGEGSVVCENNVCPNVSSGRGGSALTSAGTTSGVEEQLGACVVLQYLLVATACTRLGRNLDYGRNALAIVGRCIGLWSQLWLASGKRFGKENSMRRGEIYDAMPSG